MCAGNEGEVRSQPRRSGDRLSGEEKERRARREERTTNAIVGGRERRRIERESVGPRAGTRWASVAPPCSRKLLLGGPAGCRERFCVFTHRTCIMNQPAGLATYCQSKARYSWSIFRKISPYDLPDCPAELPVIVSLWPKQNGAIYL